MDRMTQAGKDACQPGGAHLPALRPFQSRRWRGWVDASWQPVLAELDAWLTDHPGTVVVDKRARTVFRVETPQGVVYVKIMRHLQERGRPFKRLLAGLKWYFRPSRALAVLRVSSAMLSRGIGCPEPVLAARRRSRLGWPEDIFISREVASPSVNRLLHEQRDGGAQAGVMVSVARAVARLHNQGFVHGDCLPGNISLDADGMACFLDNDRTWFAPVLGARRARMKNLLQFLSRLPPVLDHVGLADVFLNAYYQASSDAAMSGGRQRARLCREVQRRQAFLSAKQVDKRGGAVLAGSRSGRSAR